MLRLMSQQRKEASLAQAKQIHALRDEMQSLLLAAQRMPSPEQSTIFDHQARSVDTRVGIHDDDERRLWAEDKRRMQVRIPPFPHPSSSKHSY